MGIITPLMYFDIGILRGPMIMPIGLSSNPTITIHQWQPLQVVKLTGKSPVKNPNRHFDTLESDKQARLLINLTI
jgi:hypothetical protein